MNVITKALDEVKWRIPMEVLETVFINRHIGWRAPQVSLDEQITSLVIRPRVMVDCNLIGGTEAVIPLRGLPAERLDDYTWVYVVPKDRTGGRTINSVRSIAYTDINMQSNYGMANNYGYNAVSAGGAAVMNAMAPIPTTSTAEIQLIAENTVMVRDITILPPNVSLRCVLANDDTLSHLQLRSYPRFAQLVVIAVKAYIYNTYIVKMGSAELQGGMDLGVFKTIVESYADADELYETFLREKMQKILMMNDRESNNIFWRLNMGGNR